jgi:hypothetical protein
MKGMSKSSGIAILSLLVALLVLSAWTTPASASQGEEQVWGADWSGAEASIRQLKSDHPGVEFHRLNGRVSRIYGNTFGGGSSPENAAEAFRVSYAQALGADASDLRPESLLKDKRHTQPLMYDRKTGQYKFTLVYYSQVRDGVPVFRGDLRVLVRNEPGYPVVLAASALRNIGNFVPSATEVRFDPAIQANTGMTEFEDIETVIWAGVDDINAAPRLAVSFVGRNDRTDDGYEQNLYVCDAFTGEILYKQSLIYFVDITGNVQAMATPGAKANICTPEVLFPYPWARVQVEGGSMLYSDRDGNYTIPYSGSGSVTVYSYVDGLYFTVDNRAGAEETLTQLVTPPGPADFIHNEANISDLVLAQTNVYISANGVRDWVLDQNPSYPGIPTETGVPTVVNRTDYYCPCNAWSDPSDGSINFCQPGGGCPNTGWQSVVNHEYGHHVIDFSSSGQGEYGEGMADCFSMLPVDDPVLGYGFSGDCNSGLRTADNDCQYSATGCSSCGSEIHDCGQLLSGCVWDVRNELYITEPTDYLSIISSLCVNSILLHTGTGINAQIPIDFLTLDDDDGNLDNGTPHWNEICTGFGLHGIDCPELTPIYFTYPDGIPEIVPPLAETTFHVVANTGGVAPVPGTGELHYSIDGASFQIGTMTQTATNEYDAVLPAAACESSIDWYVSADATGFGTVTDPSDAPASYYTAVVATSVTDVFSDNCETDLGWTVSGDAADGQWTRGIPVGGGDRGDPPTDYDGSGQCYLTDNVDGNSDVDDGTTSLTSPTIDLSTGDAQISYARWYSNNNGADPYNDEMHVYISNDDGSSWILVETVGPVDQAGGGWYEHSFFVSDFVTPTSQMKLRFDASDLGSGSVVEAGLDAIKATVYECQGEPQVFIMTESIPAWTQNLPGYSFTLSADYGTEPYTWIDEYGDLVGTGLSLSSAGVISGTPTSAGIITFTAYVEDAGATFDEKQFTININPQPAITTTTVPDWTVGRFYNQVLNATGGTGGLTWSDADNDLNGTGLVLNASSGQLYGVPAVVGPISFTASVADTVGATDDQLLQFTINPVLTITTESPLPSWVVGTPGYSVQLETNGGTGTKTWSDLHSDLVGTGLSLSATGLVSGTPTTDGSLTFTARVVDGIGGMAERLFSIEIQPTLQITTEPPLAAWTVTVPGYADTLAGSGGTLPYVWVDLNSDLAGTGLALSTAGILAGTPGVEGTITFTAQVTDSVGLIAEKELSLTVNPMPTILTEPPLPEWTVDVSGYSTTLTGTGGTGMRVFSDKNGDLSGTGLMLRPAGTIVGTPTATGDLSFIAKYTDGVGASDEKAYVIHINDHVLITTDTDLPQGTQGVAGYSATLEATGGTGSLTWTQVGTGLDGSGLVLSTSGEVTGIPAYYGDVSFTAQAADALDDSDQKAFSIHILPDWICGDADGDELVNISDVVFLVSYIFGGGPAPEPLQAADANCDTNVNISDAVYLVSYIFGGGDAPCAACPLAKR